jgi:hypothetical protein
MSHILTYLGAFISSQRTHGNIRKKSLKIFYNAITDLCKEALFDCNEDKRGRNEVDYNYGPALWLSGHGIRYVSEGQEPEIKNVWFPLFWSVISERSSCESFVEMLDSNEFNIGHTLLIDNEALIHYASATKHDNVDKLQAIIARAPNAVKQKDVFGNVALHFAARYCSHVDTFRYLLELDPAAASAKNYRGCTPAHELFLHQRDEIVLRDMVECLIQVNLCLK